MLTFKKNSISAVTILSIGIVMATVASLGFWSMKQHDKIYPSDRLSSEKMLSNYLPNLKGTNGDTRIYVYESGKPGATILLLGGTHPNEPAGYISAVVLIENLSIKSGRIFIIPQACKSGFTCTDPMEGSPSGYMIKTKNSGRHFSFGSRVCNPLDQWPDPEVYTHYPSGQKLSGFETRNLNRSYPGKPNGTLTERVGYAIIELIKKEKVNIAFDLHEAAPEVMIINAIIAHEKAKDIAATAVLNLEFENLTYSLEISPKNFHGLSHREWGDSTDVYPFLMETSNPIQGRLRGKTNEELILKGEDGFYKTAAQLKNVRITYELNGEPLSLRVARHLQGFRRIVEAYNEQFPENTVIVENVPEYTSVITQGVGSFLK